MRAKRAQRAVTQNFGNTLDTLVPLTARHCGKDSLATETGAVEQNQ